MPSNLELKTRLPALEPALALARALGAREMGVLRQTDTYFRVSHGRLKLRECAGKEAELIYYQRDETGRDRVSAFSVIPVPDAAPMRRALAAALGVRGVVSKSRHLFLAGDVRIHIDEVEGLGTHLEFEIPVEGDLRRAQETLRGLSRTFSVDPASCPQGSYIDLLEEQASPRLR